MKVVDNERTVTGATSQQQNVDGLLQALLGQQSARPLEYIIYDLEGYEVDLDFNNKIISIPHKKSCKELTRLSIEARQYGWHTQYGVFKNDPSS